jgi:hypothetical protein
MSQKPSVISFSMTDGIAGGHPSYIRHFIRHSVFRRDGKPLAEMMTDMTDKVPICWDSSEKT